MVKEIKEQNLSIFKSLNTSDDFFNLFKKVILICNFKKLFSIRMSFAILTVFLYQIDLTQRYILGIYLNTYVGMELLVV
jgi:hypothetical protein